LGIAPRISRRIMDIDAAQWQRDEDDWDRTQGRLDDFRHAHGTPDPSTEADWEKAQRKEPVGDEEHDWPPMPPEAELPEPADIDPEDAPF
jgi:hypothetical protein